MPEAAAWQERFAACLLGASPAIPAGVIGPGGRPGASRFAVYRNNVAVGLTDALAANFPAVLRIVGDEFFRGAARAFAVRHPPASPVLLDYGAGFADFIAGFAPAAPLPYLADVARIECAWTEAYHAAEAAPLGPAALAAVPIDRVAGLRFAVHPSLRVLTSSFPALTIWRMNVGDGVPAPIDLDAGGEDSLILRPGADVEARSIPPGGVAFLTALADGASLADAAERALAAVPGFELATHLSALIGAGAFIGCHLGADAPSPAPAAGAT